MNLLEFIKIWFVSLALGLLQRMFLKWKNALPFLSEMFH